MFYTTNIGKVYCMTIWIFEKYQQWTNCDIFDPKTAVQLQPKLWFLLYYRHLRQWMLLRFYPMINERQVGYGCARWSLGVDNNNFWLENVEFFSSCLRCTPLHSIALHCASLRSIAKPVVFRKTSAFYQMTSDTRLKYGVQTW